MITGDQLIKGNRYKIPGCPNVFIFDGKYHNNSQCFTREHDGERHFGREFIEFQDGKAYLNLDAVDPETGKVG